MEREKPKALGDQVGPAAPALRTATIAQEPRGNHRAHPNNRDRVDAGLDRGRVWGRPAPPLGSCRTVQRSSTLAPAGH